MIDPDLLLRAYAISVFPMADARDADEVFWVEPPAMAAGVADRLGNCRYRKLVEVRKRSRGSAALTRSGRRDKQTRCRL